ncbi:hypothetical protein Q9966_010131 [Columba livia]|nr:hypothetical protein Q9966_010131 [Columba livia]
MSPTRRKRFWNAECTPFPDETPLQLKKSNVRTSVALTSISNAWLRCGDGFQSTSVLESVRSADKKSRIKKHLGPLLTSAESGVGFAAAESSKEAEDIIWTSSGSDFSDDESKTLISRLRSKKSHAFKTEVSPSRCDLLLEDSSSEDEPEFIDWEKDSDSTDRCDGSEKDDSSLEISDSDSCKNINSLPVKEENDELCKTTAFSTTVDGLALSSVELLPPDCQDVCDVIVPSPRYHGITAKAVSELGTFPVTFRYSNKTTPTDISEYSSDNDSVGEGKTGPATTAPGSSERLGPRLGVDTGDAAARPASEWLRGGLAERLCRLQNRERSAISFWRHQCTSDAKIPSDKSGVLIVKILEMFEECTMQVAICQQLEQSPAALSSEDAVVSAEEPILKVLFARETAAHLKSRPQDVIHIYPPWQLSEQPPLPDTLGLQFEKLGVRAKSEPGGIRRPEQCVNQTQSENMHCLEDRETESLGNFWSVSYGLADELARRKGQGEAPEMSDIDGHLAL